MAVTASAPLPRLSLREIEDQRLDVLVKGLPPGASLRLGDVGKQGWNVLTGDMPMPVSYTHLDVYKRQLQESMRGSSPVRSERASSLAERTADSRASVCGFSR